MGTSTPRSRCQSANSFLKHQPTVSPTKPPHNFSKLTKKTGHMENWQQWNPARDVRQDGFGVTVNDRVYAGKHLEHLAVNKPFRIALLRIWIHGRRILNPVLDQVVRRRDNAGGHVT